MASSLAPSLEETLSQEGFEEIDLDIVCPYDVAITIAEKIINWKMVGRHLNLSDEKLAAIELNNRLEEERRVVSIVTWKNKYGNRATFLQLAKALYRINRCDLVDSLCKELKLHLAHNSPPSTSTEIIPGPVVHTRDPGVDDRMSELERWFYTLLMQLETELSDKGVTVDEFLPSLTKLPHKFRSEYDSAIQERLTDIEAASRIKKLFRRLDPLFSFIDYSLPHHLISEFGSIELKGKMKLYVLSIRAFMRETTLADVMDIWPGNEGSGTASFSRLRVMLDKDPNKCTLEKLENIRRRVCSDLRLSECMTKLVSLAATNSFTATWLIPTEAIPEILEAASYVDKSFYENEQVLMVLLDETHSLYLSGKLNKQKASFVPPRTRPNDRGLSSLQYVILFMLITFGGCVYYVSTVQNTPNIGLISQPPTIDILKQPPICLFDKLIGIEDSFGKLLLNDTTGSILMTIEKSSNKISDKIVQICSLWIDGEGRLPVTWSTLINVLNELQLQSLAFEIHNLVDPRVFNTSGSGFNWPSISHLWHMIRNIIWKSPDSVVISKPPDITFLQQPPITIIIDEFNRLDEIYLFTFGEYLLGDETGELIKTMKSDMKSAYEIGMEICKQWIEGKGTKPVTWNALIDALLSIKRDELAQNVTKSINETVLNTQALYATFYDFICRLKAIYIDLPINENTFGNLTNKFFDITLVQLYGHYSLLFQLDEIENQKRISLWTLLDELDSSTSKHLHITGLFGAGKTTLMRYIAKMWAEGRVLHHCEVLFLINEHQEDKVNLDIQQLISTSFPQLTAYAADLTNLTKEIEVKHGAGVCLLRDGYHSKFDYYLYEKSLHSLRWIVTSHTNEDLTMWYYDIKYVQLTGINNNSLELYLNQLASEIKVTKTVLELWNLYPELREMCTFPRHLVNMIIVTATFDNTKKMTRTELYTAFATQYYCDEHQGMSCDSNSLYLCIHSSSDNESDMCNAFKAMCTVAFDITPFSQADAHYENMSGVMQRNINRLGFTTVSDYTIVEGQVEFMINFYHPYFAHYFAALHLTTLSQNEQFLYLYSQSQRSSFVSVTFFFGLMSTWYPNHQNNNLLKRFYIYKSHHHRLSSGFCNFEIDTHFFDVIQDIQWPEKQKSDINFLKSEHIIVNNSLCITGHNSSTGNSFIKNLLKHNISTFQLSTGKNITFLFENHTDTFDDEYMKLIPCLYDGNMEKNHFPSVTTIIGHYSIISNFSTMINRQHFPALHSLQIIDLIATKSDGRAVLDVISMLVHLKMLKISIKCSLFPVIFDEPETFVNVSYLHLELWQCVSSDLDVIPWVTETHQFMCPIRPVQSVLKPFNQLKALTLIEPHESVTIHYLLYEAAHNLQRLQLRKVNINVIDINQLIETLNQLQNLQILEISQTNLGNTELEELFNHLPHSLQELSLSNCHLKNHQVISLSKALQTLSNLNSLNLSDNAITGEGLTKLVGALKYHKNFHSLDLSYHGQLPGSIVCGTEIEELSQLTNLHHLNIQGCRVPRNIKKSLFKMFGQLAELRSLHLCLVMESNEFQKLSLILTNHSEIEPHCDLYKQLSNDPMGSLEMLNSTGNLLSLLKNLSLSGDPLRLLKVLSSDPKDLLSEVNITNILQHYMRPTDHNSVYRMLHSRIHFWIEVNWKHKYTSEIKDFCEWRHPDLLDFHASLTNLPQLQNLNMKCRLP